MRKDGINRIGNMYVPNENYCFLEDFMVPIIEDLEQKQEKENVNWTPSKLIFEIGKKINNEESIYYWCSKN
jgi:deoxyhypusine synthase